MKRYLLKLLAFACIQCIFAVLLWQGAPRPPEEPPSDHYLAALIDKHEALLNRPGPRLLIVGGSSAAFGIYSPVFQQKLQLAPVNLGIHGAAGLEFMLRHAESHAQSGDVVLLCPEPGLLAGELMAPHPSVTGQILDVWPAGARYMPQEALPRLPLAEWKSYFDRLAMEKLQQRLRHGIFHAPESPSPSPPNTAFKYARSGFNEFGDMVGHYTEKPKPFSIPAEGNIDQHLMEVATSRINRFFENCQRKGARVFLAYAPLLKGTQPRTTELHEILGKQLRVPILHHPDECTFCTEDFFDSFMHLHEEAAKKRSQFLADRLHEQLSLARSSDTKVIRR